MSINTLHKGDDDDDDDNNNNNNNTWNTHIKRKVLQCKALKPERWGSLLVQEKYEEEKACDRRHPYWIIIIIIIIIRYMRFVCWITEATNTHSECVILIALPLQQWLRERAWMLRHTYTLPVLLTDVAGLLTRLSRSLYHCLSRRFWNEFLWRSICVPYWCFQNVVIGRCGRAVDTPVCIRSVRGCDVSPETVQTECGAVCSPSFATGRHRGSTTNCLVFSPLSIWTSWSLWDVMPCFC